MLNTLIKYYERNQLQGDSNSLEYKVAKHKLQQILQDAVNTFTPSKEIQELLEKYLPKEEDSDPEQELEDIIIPTLNAGIITTELTEDSLRKFEAEKKEINPTKAVILSEDYLSEFTDTVVVLGNGSHKWKSICTNKNVIFDEGFDHPNAQFIGPMAYERFLNKSFENLVTLEPQYLKEFMGTQPKKFM